MEREFKPTDEQEAVASAVANRDAGSVMVNAYAGCSKTTTIKLASKRVRSSALALAFNKAIATELQGHLGGSWTTKTLNGLGYGAWSRANPGVDFQTPDSRKIGKLVNEVAREWKTHGKSGLPSELWSSACGMVSRAMNNGLTPHNIGDPLMPDDDENWAGFAEEMWTPKEDVPMLIDLCREVLVRSIAMSRAGLMSFDDQVYCPVVLGGRFIPYPFVAVDEAQDLNGLNHEMIKKSLLPQGRLLAVGDPKQAIYAFRGALSDSMEYMRDLRDSWQDAPLTTTFRCPKVVVERQQKHAPGFRAFDTNRLGVFARQQASYHEAGETKGGWTWEDVKTAQAQFGCNNVVMLCRNNAPLMEMAMKLLRRRIGPHYVGRDIGKNLITLSRKISPDDATPRDSFLAALNDWRQAERDIAIANGQDEKISSIEDRAACLRAVCDSNTANVGIARMQLEQIFAREGGEVTLSTIHKAKGLEWDFVIHLDPWRIPSKYALTEAEQGNRIPLQQDLNLLYVCETRTRNVLWNAEVEDFR